MAKIFTIISMIIMLALFPPSVLALISNNAVPGDSTYSIKRTLEDGVIAITSVNPVTKVWFSQARTGRRLDEAATIILRKKSVAPAYDSLNEYIEQLRETAKQVKD